MYWRKRDTGTGAETGSFQEYVYTTDYLAYLRARNLVFADALRKLFNNSIQTTEMVLFSQ